MQIAHLRFPRLALPILALVLLLAPALAQEVPSLHLDSQTYELGAPVTVSGTGLEPGEEYRLTVVDPAGESSEVIVEAQPDGSLEHVLEPDQAGDWTVELTGAGLSGVLEYEVIERGEAGGAQAREDGTEAPAEPTEGPEEATEAAAGPAEADEAATEPEAAAEAGETTGEAEEEAADEGTGEPVPAPSGPVEVGLDGDDVVATAAGQVAWRFAFPDGSGGTAALFAQDGTVWIGHGNSLLAVDEQTGTAQERFPMPGKVIRIEETDAGTLSVVSDIDGRLRGRMEVTEDGTLTPVRFGVDEESFDWLRREAQVEDPAARLQQDPTNPWLHLNAGLQVEDSAERTAHFEEAVARGRTFYDLAGVAQELYAAGESELAAEAMDAAMQDFARRGYDPRLLADDELHRAYNFPLEPTEQALAQSDLDAAAFWAPWLYLVANEASPQTGEALAEYSRQLQSVGQRDAASLWRERSREHASASPTAGLERFFLMLGRSGWYGVAAIIAAILALHLTLIAKYWAPQSLAMRRRAETGGPRRPWTRLFAIRYYTFTEKLVLVLLFAVSLTLLGLVRWYGDSGQAQPALTSGTLASPLARDLVATIPLEGERGAFVRGYSAHVTGNSDDALEEYVAAGEFPPALNNRAALEGDDALYQRALELAPAMQEAAYNLGRRADPSPFHSEYRSDQPLLAVPDESSFRIAVAGNWQNAIGTTFQNPWTSLRDLDFFGLPNWLWQVLLALYLLWAVTTLVWLLIPAPGFARNAPRSIAYHLLALLVPGSGLADEAWGILLIVPWALFGVDALSYLAGWERTLGLPIETVYWALGAIYLINLIAFVVEFVSYSRRMRQLKRETPEAIEAYSLRSA